MSVTITPEGMKQILKEGTRAFMEGRLCLLRTGADIFEAKIIDREGKVIAEFDEVYQISVGSNFSVDGVKLQMDVTLSS